LCVFYAVLFMLLFLTFLRLVNVFPLWRSRRVTRGIASQWLKSFKAKKECFLLCQERSLLDVQRYQHRICWNYCCQLLFSFGIYLYIQGLDNEYKHLVLDHNNLLVWCRTSFYGQFSIIWSCV